MVDPATAASIFTAGKIAELAFQKFLESGAGEIGKQFTTEAIAKMDTLLKRIWAKLRGKPRAEEVKALVETTQKITPEQVNQIAAYLQVAMDEDPQFANDIKLLAHEISLGKRVDHSSMNQTNHGGTNFQNKIDGSGKVYQAETIHITET